MGAPVYPAKGVGRWWGAVIPPFPPPPFPSCGYTPPQRCTRMRSRRTHAAAAAGSQGNVGGVGGEGGGAQEGMGQGRG